MRNIFFVLFFCATTLTFAQFDFGAGQDKDTLLPTFETELESQVYVYLRERPILSEEWKILTLSPMSIVMWSEHAGWDIIVLDPVEGRAKGFLYDFSWNATELPDSVVMMRLREIISHKQKSP